MGCMLRTWTGGVVNWHLQTRSSRCAIAMRGSGGSQGLCSSSLQPIIAVVVYCGSRGDGPGREKTDRARLCRAGAGSGSAGALPPLKAFGRWRCAGAVYQRSKNGGKWFPIQNNPKNVRNGGACLNQVRYDQLSSGSPLPGISLAVSPMSCCAPNIAPW